MRRSSTPGPRRRTMIVTAAAAVALFGSILPVHAAPGDDVPPGIDRLAERDPGATYGPMNGALKGSSPLLSALLDGVEGEVSTDQWVWVRPR